ncbi:class I SAM-dependent methyltransferase [Marinicrinis sediminis]|uniref:Class I SAM-dependent methyltransferase n=1 Tax=Marinicrinis sediminis TaxID=1652465 RepID=A0ABW5RB99_9BACL
MQTHHWNANQYDEQHGYVSGYGQELIDVLAPVKGENILDVGCGTGDLAAEIAQYGSHVYGIDGSAEMINQARSKYPQLNLAVADGQRFHLNQQFDAVFSNAAIHWMKEEPEGVIRCIHQHLKPNGRFVAEMGGFGNIQHIIEAILHVLQQDHGIDASPLLPWYFPTRETYTALLTHHEFTVHMANIVPRPTPLVPGEQSMRHWLEQFASSLFVSLDAEQRDSCLHRVVELLKPKLYDGTRWTADYVRLRVYATKNE